jgi:hypothetical protein
MEYLSFQIFAVASTTLASYLTIIYCKRRSYCKLCKISRKIKEEHKEIQKYANLRRSKRLEEKRNKK